jgi:hypothetical protein
MHIALTCRYRRTLLASSPAVSWQHAGAADAAKAAISEESPGFNLIDVAKAQLSVRTVRFPAATAEDAQSARQARESRQQAAAAEPAEQSGDSASA